MSNERTVKFDVKPTGSSNLSLSFWDVITLPFRRLVPAVGFSLVVWTIVYNVGVRYWKGPDHPVNRFQWRRMEKAGELPEELLRKKKVLLDYYKSRIFSPRPGPASTDNF